MNESAARHRHGPLTAPAVYELNRMALSLALLDSDLTPHRRARCCSGVHAPVLLKVEARAVPQLGVCDAVSRPHLPAVCAEIDDGVVAVNPAHALPPGEGIGAGSNELGGTVAGEERHHYEDVLRSDREIHRAADGGDRIRLTRVPVGEVSSQGDLEGTEHADVEVAPAHHGEGVGVVEVGGSWGLDDGNLAGVDEVRVGLGTDGGAAMPSMPFSVWSTTCW